MTPPMQNEQAWKIVPVAPTQEMIAAMIPLADMPTRYKSALSASPDSGMVMVSREDAETLAYVTKSLAKYGKYEPLSFNFSDMAARLSSALGDA